MENNQKYYFHSSEVKFVLMIAALVHDLGGKIVNSSAECDIDAVDRLVSKELNPRFYFLIKALLPAVNYSSPQNQFVIDSRVAPSEVDTNGEFFLLQPKQDNYSDLEKLQMFIAFCDLAQVMAPGYEEVVLTLPFVDPPYKPVRAFFDFLRRANKVLELNMEKKLAPYMIHFRKNAG